MIEIEFIDGTKDYIPNILREKYEKGIEELFEKINDCSCNFIMINTNDISNSPILNKKEIRKISYVEDEKINLLDMFKQLS